jgi:hypothetical protein
MGQARLLLLLVLHAHGSHVVPDQEQCGPTVQVRQLLLLLQQLLMMMTVHS